MLHSPGNTFFKENMSNLMLKAFNNVNCIQVLVKSDVNDIHKFYPNTFIIYLPNIVSINELKYNKKNNNKIISVGRITKYPKRQHILLKVYNKIKNEISTEWVMEIVGGVGTKDDIIYKNKLMKYVNDNKLSNKVYFTDPIKNINDKLNSADIFTFPSTYEGFGIALTEAMAAGLPAIGYKSCPSVNELIIDGYNGFLCEDGIDDFAEKLKILMQDAELRKKMGQNARESMKQFAPEKIWDEWEKLIYKVVSKSKKRSSQVEHKIKLFRRHTRYSSFNSGYMAFCFVFLSASC